MHVDKNEKGKKRSDKGNKRVVATSAPDPRNVDQQVAEGSGPSAEAAGDDIASDGHDSDGIPALRHVDGRKKAKRTASENRSHEQALSMIIDGQCRSQAESAAALQLDIKKAELEERKVKAMEESIRARREATALNQRREDFQLLLMNVDSNNVSYDMMTIIEGHRKQAMQRLRAALTEAEKSDEDDVEESEQEPYDSYDEFSDQ